MGTISKDNQRRVTLFSSIQLKFALTYILLIAVVLVLINTYSLSASRDLIITTKQYSLQKQAAVIGTSLGQPKSLTADTVSEVMKLMDVTGLTRVIITNSTGSILYDSSATTQNAEDENTVAADIKSALMGNDLFQSTFSDGAFKSSASQPIVNNSTGLVSGAVHLYEYDADQGTILLALQNNLKNISIAIGILAFILSVFFTRTMTRRIVRILEAIKVVRGGEYNYHVKIRGKDEINQLGEEFNRLTDRLQSTEEVRRRFVSDASHELKTPLASIRLLSDSILQNTAMDTETIHEFVDDIGKEAERLARTTEKLLSLTRLDSKLVSERTRVDIRSVTVTTLRMLKPLADSRTVALESDLNDGCTILANEDDISQIVFNLAENAIKYNLPGGSVRLSLRCSSDKVQLTVDDTGIGVPADDLPHIFDRFYRVDKARSREAGGSGLGLSIVKNTVREHGGTIEAIPRDAGGMRFQVTFPLFVPETEETLD